MAAIKYETFALESDDAERDKASVEAELAKARDEAYARGFKDGVNVTNEAIQSCESEVGNSVREALADVSLSQTATANRALAQVSKLVEAFCRAVAPNLAKTGLDAELGGLLAAVIKDHSENELVISHAIADGEMLNRFVGENGPDIVLKPDPDLKPRQVTVAWEDGFDRIDMDEAVAKALMKITNFTQLVDKEENDERDNALAG